MFFMNKFCSTYFNQMTVCVYLYITIFQIIIMSGIHLRNNESFFEYNKVIKYSKGSSNPIKPEGFYDIFDPAQMYLIIS